MKAQKTDTVVVITKEWVKNLAVSGRRETWRDATCRGLLLRVGASGSKTYALDYRDAAGKRQTYKIGNAANMNPGDARKEVERLRTQDPAAVRRTKRRDEALADARTLRAFVEGRYWHEKLRYARSGAATRGRIKAAWSPFLDDDMSKLKASEVDSHRAKRAADSVKPQTLNRDRTALLAALNQAAKWQLIGSNPLQDHAFERMDVDDDKRVRWLGQRDEHENVREGGHKVGERARFDAALEHPETPDYLRQMVRLVQHTGLRRGEAFKLRWEHVSLKNRKLTVDARTAKSGKTRHIDLNVPALAALGEVAKVKHISGYVFLNPDTGQPFTTTKRSWASLVKRARLQDFTFHDLRHDFASRLVQAGVSLYVVRDLLGHSSIVLTERYAHLAPGQHRAAVATLEKTA